MISRRIGITLRIVKASNYDEMRDSLSHDWELFLQKLNFFPIFIPNSLSDVESFLKEMEVDGLILSGGDNIGENKERDKTERKIIKFGITYKIPIFGVCRGMQVLNDYFGGKLTMDDSIKHVENPHKISLSSVKLQSILEKDSFQVNSFHKNLIKKNQLGKDLKLFAYCPTDMTVEGFIHKDYPIMGVMWHPERSGDIYNQKILQDFFKSKKTSA